MKVLNKIWYRITLDDKRVITCRKINDKNNKCMMNLSITIEIQKNEY